MTDPTPEEKQARRALHCLYIAVDESIARDVQRDVEAWVRAAVAAETERAAKIVDRIGIDLDSEQAADLIRRGEDATALPTSSPPEDTTSASEAGGEGG